MKINSLSEEGIINYVQKIIKTSKNTRLGIGDDAAVIEFDRGRYLLYTCDMIVEGTHFTKDTPARNIGHKALAVACSDIAAMGGIPKYATVSLGLPKLKSFRFIQDLYKGMLDLAKKIKVDIVGGDTNRAGRVIVDISVIGLVEKRHLTLRSSAKQGDSIFVSGRLGGSIYGRHLNFIPRITEARNLVNNYNIHAMIDVSDGLVQDLYHLTKASNVGALIREESIPVSKVARSLKDALYMGEDFELLFTISRPQANRLTRNQAFFRIGEITDKKFGLKMLHKNGKIKKLTLLGFRHF